MDVLSTLDRAYTQLLASMNDTAQDHVNLADALTSQVVEPLKATERKHEDTKKKEMQYYQKLLSDRDRAYADRIKVGLIRLLDLFLTRTCSSPATEQAEGRAVPFTGIRKL